VSLRTIVLGLALAALGWAQQAWAWDAVGHRAVAEIALANVTPQTAARIRGLLKAQGQLHTPGCPIASLDDAANWPDCLRGDPDHWKFTFAWHYQDEPVCGHFDVQADCPGGACVSAQIVRMRRILADRHQGAAQRLVALAFLTHFVGDIHQPLHVADHGDRGGNDVILHNPPKALAGDGTRPVSLHWLWDSLPDWLVNDPAHPLLRVYTPAERARIATGDVADWARESYDLGRKFAYTRAFHHDPCAGSTPQTIFVSDADIRASLPLVRQRLIQAGLRLAKVLDQALGGSA
jgi:hypothetical protein